MLFAVDEELVVVDAASGVMRTRVPNDSARETRVEVNPQAGLVLVQTLVSMDITLPCISELRLFDLASGIQQKTLCGFEWTFSRDGARLAYRELVHVEGAERPLGRLVVLDTKTLEPLRSLPESLTNRRDAV